MWTIHMRATYNFGCCRYGRMNHLNQLDRWKWDVVVVSLIQPAGSRGVFTHFDQNTAVVKLSTGRTLCITCWMILCKFLRIVVSLDVAIWVFWTDISGLRKVGSLWDCFLSRARQAGGIWERAILPEYVVWEGRGGETGCISEDFWGFHECQYVISGKKESVHVCVLRDGIISELDSSSNACTTNLMMKNKTLTICA